MLDHVSTSHNTILDGIVQAIVDWVPFVVALTLIDLALRSLGINLFRLTS